MDQLPVIIIGAGPAGLAAAYELARRGLPSTVLEKADKVGGLARTEVYKGYRFDIGGHRFVTKFKEVQDLWETIMGDDFREVSRLSRIYYRHRFFQYPLDLLNTIGNLGLSESLMILLSYFRSLLWPYHQEETFEQWVSNRFSRRLYKTFFQAYTEKVWGIPCNEIQADWAAQRITGLSLVTALTNALFKQNNVKTLLNKFYYPVFGPGQMWERLQQRVQDLGGQVHLRSNVIRLEVTGRNIKEIIVQQGEKQSPLRGRHFLSTMPLGNLLSRLEPGPPPEVMEAARRFKYRDFILVGLIVNQADLFPDNWIYVHSEKVRVGRIQNFKNWSAALVPDLRKTSIGMEYFCTQGDDLWAMSEKELIALATAELSSLGLADAADVESGVVFRQPKAYPVYNLGYRENLEVVRRFLATLDNLQTIGRNGMHQYYNMDLSMLSALMAVWNLLGENRDLWRIREAIADAEAAPISEGG